jgi:LmbE family N-acetylglucosaminyl deacetylase
MALLKFRQCDKIRINKEFARGNDMRILMIGAHQDDNEFRCGGLTSKLVKKGHEVCFLSMCNGCGGHHALTPEETVKKRAEESAAVAKFLRITYDVWDIDDCNLVADLPTRKKLIRYIRNYNPDLIITHRPNDYHADHRAAGQLVQDASYLLTVPHECLDVPAMRFMPVIMYNEDKFKNPEFHPDIVIDIDDEIDIKLHIAHLNVSQVYEWLPYTYGEEVPEGEAERFEWLKGMNITKDTTDEEVMAATRGYAVRFAKTAARFRKELIERYGQERGSKVRYAEAYEVCEYGNPLIGEMKDELLSF